MNFRYLTCCVNANGQDITEMVDVARKITYNTMRKYIPIDELKTIFDYSWGREKGLRMSKDYHVRYYKSVFCGQPCIFIDHSAIEHVFVLQ